MRLGLTTQPFILVGLISYSIYLWHWPLIVFGHAIEAKHQITISPALYFVVSLFIGWLSWRFIECPIRINRHRWVPLILLIGATSSAFFIYALRDFNTKERTLNMHAGRWDGELYNVNPVTVWPESVHRRMQGIEVTPRPAGRIDSYLSGIDHQYGSHEKLDVMVLGDSHGLMWAPAIDAAAQDLRLNIKYMTADGTPVFLIPPDLRLCMMEFSLVGINGLRLTVRDLKSFGKIVRQLSLLVQHGIARSRPALSLCCVKLSKEGVKYC